MGTFQEYRCKREHNGRGLLVVVGVEAMYRGGLCLHPCLWGWGGGVVMPSPWGRKPGNNTIFSVVCSNNPPVLTNQGHFIRCRTLDAFCGCKKTGLFVCVKFDQKFRSQPTQIFQLHGAGGQSGDLGIQNPFSLPAAAQV